MTSIITRVVTVVGLALFIAILIVIYTESIKVGE